MNYRDSSLSPQDRVKDLLSRMTVKEKINQMCCKSLLSNRESDCDGINENGLGNISALLPVENVSELADRLEAIQVFLRENTRLGIPAFIHCEAVSGGVFAEATAFPSAIGQASTWDPDLINEMALFIREQMISVGYRHALSPVFDISRDPRWGRLTETYGEDETLASAMAVAFVSGLQNDDSKRGSVATGKHFVGHGLTECGLNQGQNLITERELREVHCKPFQAAISMAKLMGVMNSYCSINREAIVGSKRILTNLLRDEMGFSGILVSDYLSINRLIDPYQTVNNPLDAGIQALEAGIDIEYPAPYGFSDELVKSIEDGKIGIEDVDRSVERILKIKFEIGLFDNPLPEKRNIQEIFHSKDGEKIALKTAQESITLLKNDNHVLPLDKDISRIAVVGPHSDSIRSLFGSYSYPGLLEMFEDMKNNDFLPGGGVELVQRFPGDLRETPIHIQKQIQKVYPRSKTLLHAISDYLPNVEVTSAMGISYTGNNVSDYEHALNIAANSDVIILTLGGRSAWGLVGTNGEGADNSNIDLPGLQEDFARSIRSLNKKTVVIHFDGKPLSNEYVATHFDAILEAWQLGEQGGQALVSVLFGDYNPSGRLPITAARSVAQLPAYYGLPRGSGYVSAGRFAIFTNPYGYTNDTIHPLYYFGHGLSYTEFKYSNLRLSSKKVGPEEKLSVSIDIKNIGNYDGDEVVQLYVSDVLSSMVRPDQQLIGFKRVKIKSKETTTVKFTFDMSLLAFIDIDMQWKIEAGEMALKIGASCVDIRLVENFEITSSKHIDPKHRSFFSKAEVLN